MRAIDNLPMGNPYKGPWRKSALELPAWNEIEFFSPMFLVAVYGAHFLLAWAISGDTSPELDRLRLLVLPYRLAFLAFFGWHYCTRYTLMLPERRTAALGLYFLIGLPLALLLPWWMTLLAALRPDAVWRSTKSWFSYPVVTHPGLYRSPINDPFARLLLSLSADFHLAWFAILPASFAVRHTQTFDFARLDRALRTSPYTEDQEALLFGLSIHDGAPITQHYTKARSHVLLPGATGKGKTAAMMNLLYQLDSIDPDPAIVVLDGKPHTLELLATLQATGRPVKWFSLENAVPTYTYNPLDQSWYQKIPTPYRRDFWTAALNLDSGSDYAHDFFTVGTMANLKAALGRQGVTAVSNMAKLVRKSNRDQKDEMRRELLGAGAHLQGVLECLSDIVPLNLPSTLDLGHSLQGGEGVYFHLPLSRAPNTSRRVGGLALQGTLEAAQQIEDKESFKAYVFVDESARFAGRNVELLLQQARSLGLSFILSLQAPDDARGQVSDVGTSAQNNADLEWIFSAWTERERRRLADVGGTMIDYQRTSSWNQLTGTTQGWAEILVSRYSGNVLDMVSAEPMLSILQPKAPEYGGAPIIIQHFFHTSEREYKRRRRMKFPDGNGETIVAAYSIPDADPEEPPGGPPPPEIDRPTKRPRR